MNTHIGRGLIAAALVLVTAANAEALRDPTQPPTARSVAPSAAAVAPLRVEAIFRHGDQMTAIVDGKLVRAGDRVGAALIQEITGDAVRYLRGGRSDIARLNNSKVNVRRPSASAEEQT